MSKRLLSLIPVGLQVEQILPGTDHLIIIVAPREPSAACPACGRPSWRIHSRYDRTLHDLPWQGRTVRLRVRARRFRCLAPDCPRQTFAERLADAAPPAGRRTVRLGDLQRHLGLASGGEVGSRLAARLAMPVSADTLLRMARHAGTAPQRSPPIRVLAVDDWAFRRGRRYGTVLVDLERNRVVDLLPDRQAETLAAWLRANPTVEVVARDRAGAYADGARQGAPTAVQVTDRWHLLRNLGDAVRTAAEGHHAAVRRAGEGVLAARGEAAPLPATGEARPGAAERRGQAARARRQTRFEEVARLHEAGVSIGETARRLGLDRKTARRWLRRGSPPSWRKPRRGSAIEVHAAYLERRWAEGCHNATRLWRELVALGFTGRSGGVRAWAARRRGAGPVPARPPLMADGRPWQPPSGRRLARILMADAGALEQADRGFAATLLEEVPVLAAAVASAKRLALLLRRRSQEALEDVLTAASATPLAGFVRELRKDIAAVQAALDLPWTTSPAEGQVNRIKLIKRTMYGRAGFDLLRARVLNAA